MATQGGMRTADQGAVAALPARTRAGAKDRLWEVDFVGRVWHFFTSVRLALVLILLLTASVMAGTLLDQAPPSVIADPASYAQWLTQARTKYGVWTNIFDFLQLFNVFHAFWFRLLIGLLTANIIVCTVNRWRGIWSTVFGTRVRMGDAFFQHARYNACLDAAMPASAAAERVKRALSRSHYRVVTEAAPESVAIYADRNRFSKFGTTLSHLSIVLILAGTIVGGIWGFRDSGFIVPEGTTRELGLGTHISVGLEHFTDEYYLEGPPKDFRSDIVIYDNGVEVKRGTIRVNSPMSYKGISFHQAFYGQTAVMDVKDPAGKALYSSGVPLAWQTRDGSRPVGNFTLPEQNLVVYVIGPKSGENDPMVPAGEMRVEIYRQDSDATVAVDNLSQGTPKELAGLNFTFQREQRFTGLKVVKDPGVNIIWAASALMVLGLVMLFYFPHRRLWALVKSRPDGTAEVRLGMTAQRDMSLAEEFNGVRRKVGRALGIAQFSEDPAQGGEDV
jgi:cytochrome c biogenesis protein